MNEKPMVQLVVEVPQGTTYQTAVAMLRAAVQRVGEEQRVPAPNGERNELVMYVGNGAAIQQKDYPGGAFDATEVGRWFVQAVENEENEK